MQDQTYSLTELLEENKRKLTYYEDSARSKVEELLKQPLLPAEQKKVYETLQRFVVLNFIYELSKKYPIISGDIFELHREEAMMVKIKDRDSYEIERKYTAILPTVVSIPIDGIRFEENYTQVVKGSRAGSTYHEDIKVSCAIPEIIPEARIALAEAIILSAELTAHAYKDSLISRILVNDRMKAKPLIPGPVGASYQLVWAPTTWNAEIVEKDPAIFMNYGRTNILVYHWTIPEETSLDSMLREYSENWFRMDEAKN